MTIKKPSARPVGRPPSGLPKRKRRNLNIQRSTEFDSDLIAIRNMMVIEKGTPLIDITQTDAIKTAVKFYVKAHSKPCERCNGMGHIAIHNGDDDQPCPECSEIPNP